ncbi:MAG: SGNH hydrolase domain-containing protein [Actinomycetota bacterium]
MAIVGIALAGVATAVAVAPGGGAFGGAGRSGRAPVADRRGVAPAWLVQPGVARHMVLLGDSIASSAADALRDAGAARGISVDSMVRWGCGLTTGVTQKTLDAALSARCAASTPQHLDEAAQRVGPGDAVVWFNSWEVNDHLVGDRVLAFRSPEWDRWYAGQLDAARARFSARGATLVLVTVAPRAPVGGIERQAPADARDTLALTEIYRRFASEHPADVVVADLAALLCPYAPQCPERIDGITVRPDSTHYGAAGAAWMAPRLLDLIDLGLARRPFGA